MDNNSPILFLCIPIYNRLEYLEKMLERFLEDKDIFQKYIYLYISDNCSSQNLASCCDKYKLKGLNLEYSRNDENIGADGNFLKCFKNAKGKFTWLLGSDDIPVRGFMRKLLELLSNNDFGLVYLDSTPNCSEVKVVTDKKELFSEINLGITFMSANIISTQSIGKIKLEPYMKTNLIQVPQYIEAGCSKELNAMVRWGEIFEKDTDALNKGGYNFYQVFVENLFSIFQSFVDGKKLDKAVLNAVKKKEYKSFVLQYSEHILRNRKSTKFKYENGFRIMLKHYGICLYAYTELAIYCFERLFGTIGRKLKND